MHALLSLGSPLRSSELRRDVTNAQPIPQEAAARHFAPERTCNFSLATVADVTVASQSRASDR